MYDANKNPVTDAMVSISVYKMLTFIVFLLYMIFFGHTFVLDVIRALKG
jgi:hypothetical protein